MPSGLEALLLTAAEAVVLVLVWLVADLHGHRGSRGLFNDQTSG